MPAARHRALARSRLILIASSSGLILRGFRLIQREAGSIDFVRSNAVRVSMILPISSRRRTRTCTGIVAFIADDARRGAPFVGT